MEVNAMYGITGEHYAIDDVFRFLELCPAVEARIDIEETGFKPSSGRGSTSYDEVAPMFAQ
jgi:hypothetical protein